MNLILLPILIAALLLTSGCKSFEQQPKTPTFSTPYGEIEKGASEAEVVAVLGIPQRIVSGAVEQSWYYNLGDEKRITAYFINGKVTMIKDSKDAGRQLEQ